MAERRSDPDAQIELRDTTRRVETILTDLAVLRAAGQLYLLIQPTALDDLRLDEGKRARAATLSARAAARWTDAFGDRTRLPPPAERIRMGLEQARSSEAEVDAILTPPQRVRLRQIALQSEGPAAFREPEVVGEKTIPAIPSFLGATGLPRQGSGGTMALLACKDSAQSGGWPCWEVKANPRNPLIALGRLTITAPRRFRPMRRLFIISDLHLGGRPDVRDQQGRLTHPGYQICHTHAELTAFIRWVATQGDGQPPSELELVINGDLVDFLADDDWDGPDRWAQVWTADEGQAVRKLEHIVQRARIGPRDGVFEALRDFLAAGHRLTLMLGNHDVELALPAVRRRLAGLLGGDSARLQFIYDGEAYVVGTVLIEHGNRYDQWNMINYSALRQERSMQSRRLPVRQEHRKDRYFVHPAGTYLVIHFINLIKKRYRFIDLLKPETNAVIPLLVALEPSYRPHLADIIGAAPIALKTLKQRIHPAHINATLPRHAGEMADWREDPARIAGASGGDWSSAAGPAGPGDLFGAGPVSAPADPGTALDEELDLRENFVPDMDASLDRVLAETLGSEALYFPAAVGKDLSDREVGRSIADWLKAQFEPLAETYESATRYFSLLTTRTDEQRLRQLHAALRHLNCNDRSFNLSHELPEYLEAAREMTQLGGFEVVTFGHTHLPKQFSFGAGGKGPPWYFNTGTWCDVMRLPAEIAVEYPAARAELEAFVEALRMNDFSRYVRRYLTFLEIELEPSDRTERVRKATLHSYMGPGRERSEPLTSYQPPQGG